jgi:hypothetical protein
MKDEIENKLSQKVVTATLFGDEIAQLRAKLELAQYALGRCKFRAEVFKGATLEIEVTNYGNAYPVVNTTRGSLTEGGLKIIEEIEEIIEGTEKVLWNSISN